MKMSTTMMKMKSTYFTVVFTICLVCSAQIDCAPTNQSIAKTTAKRESSASSVLTLDRLLQDKIFWAPTALALLPTGYEDSHNLQWVDRLRQSRVQQVTAGCGRQPNRLIHLQSVDRNHSAALRHHSRSCFRYRHNYDQLQGELFSVLLGRALNMRNFPPTAIVQLNRLPISNDALESMLAAKWNPQSLAVASEYINHLKQARFHPALSVFANRSQLNSPTHLPVLSPAYLQQLWHSKSNQSVGQSRSDSLIELMQWSDLIVFDYLIGNLDRLVNNLSNMRWNPDMLLSPVHNLYRRDDGLLVFLDQESGLLHGYRLLPTYERMHRQILQQLCLFNPNTVSRLQQLLDRVQLREELAQRLTPIQLAAQVDFLPEASLRTLTRRISKVLTQVHRCTKLQEIHITNQSEASTLS